MILMNSLLVRNLVTIVIAVAMSTIGQTLLKLGLDKIPMGRREHSVSLLFEAARQPQVVAGMLLFCASVLVWIVVLARSELSWAYPLLGISYVLVAISGWLVFGEQLSIYRILGIAFVVAGAVLVAAS